MSVKFQAQPEGQPDMTSPVVEEAQGAAEKNSQDQAAGLQPIATLDKLNEIVSQSIAKALEENERKQQSQRDKLESRVNKQIEKQVEFLRRRGIEITPEIENGVASDVRNEIKAELESLSSTPETAPSKGLEKPATAIEQSVNAEVDKMDASYGFSINDNEPEAKMLDFSSPFKFVSSYEKAMTAKADRLTSEGQRPKAPGATAHLGGGGSTPGNPLGNINSPDELWALVRKKG